MSKYELLLFLLRPRSHIYISVVVLMCGETGCLDGQTYTKAEHSDKPEKGKEVEYHHQTSYS